MGVFDVRPRGLPHPQAVTGCSAVQNAHRDAGARYLAQALRTLFGRPFYLRLRPELIHQTLHRFDDEEVHNNGDDQEADQRLNEDSVREGDIPSSEGPLAEVARRTGHHAYQRRDERGHESCHKGTERGTDDDGDREIYHVATEQELLNPPTGGLRLTLRERAPSAETPSRG